MLAIAISALASGSMAQDASEFYKDGTTTFVVGFGAGGGFDTYARIIAPHLEERLGGTVIVENRPGAGGKSALNSMFRGEHDGNEIFIVHGEAALLTQLTGGEGRRFDIEEMNWLGRIASEPGVVMLSAASPYRTIEDLKNADRPIRFSASSPADGMSDYAAVFCHVAQIECEIITGYSGSREGSLAAIRGETDAFAVEAGSAKNYASGNELIPVAVLARETTKSFPEAPPILEAVDVPEDMHWWVDFRESISSIGRSIATAPSVPEDRVAYLREQLGAVLTDEAFVKDATEKGRDINYLNGTEQQAIIDKLMSSISDERLLEVQKVLLNTYF